MAIVIVVQGPRCEQFLFSIWHEYLTTEHELPMIEEFQRPMACEFATRMVQLLA